MFKFKDMKKKKVVALPRSPGSYLVKEGVLFKRGEILPNWRRRLFYVYSDGSLEGYVENTGGIWTWKNSEQSLELNNSFTVKGCEIMKSDQPKPYTFTVRGLRPNEVIERIFYVDSEEEREEWINAFERISDALIRAESSSSSSSSMGPNSLLSKKKPSSGSLGDSMSGGSSSSSNKSSSGEEQHFGNDPNLSRGFGNLGISSGPASEEEKVTLENFEFLKVLGKGSFGKVMLCREKTSKHLYAIKFLRKTFVVNQGEVEHTLAEKRVLQKNSHPFLISLKCSFQTTERLCFVMEYVKGGELFFHLKKAEKFTEERTRFYGAEIISALGHLHRHGIIYRDVKLENLLLDQDGHIKITDYGLCKENIFFGSTTYTFCGTLQYLAPEVVRDDRGYGLAADWWSLGVVLYEMLTGRLPFSSQDNDTLCELILEFRVIYPRHLSGVARALLIGLLQKDPMERLGGGADDAEEIKKHPFFSCINWRDLEEKKIPVPFKPEVTSEMDTQNFDTTFTNEPVVLTPNRKSLNDSVTEGAAAADYDFGGFSYVASSFGASAKSLSSPLDM